MDREQELNNTYYARWQDVQNQINHENQFKEQIRQYDEQLAYYKAKDAKEYELEIKKLEEQKRQAQQAQANWEKEYALQVKQVNASIAKSSSSGGGSSKLSSGSSSNSSKTSLSNNSKQTTTSTSSVKAASTADYNKHLKTARTLYNSSKYKNSGMVEAYLATTNLNDQQIKNVLKSLGIK
jgi:hypothetical protein